MILQFRQAEPLVVEFCAMIYCGVTLESMLFADGTCQTSTKDDYGYLCTSYDSDTANRFMRITRVLFRGLVVKGEGDQIKEISFEQDGEEYHGVLYKTIHRGKRIVVALGNQAPESVVGPRLRIAA